jgi:O-antigen/teichoic acid export membrane protein
MSAPSSRNAASQLTVIRQTLFGNNTRQRLINVTAKLIHIASLIGLAQLLQLLGSLIVVRTLSKEEYGYYSMANNLLGSLAMFTTTGLSTGLMVLAGPATESVDRLSSILASASRLRCQLLTAGAIFGVPVYFWLLLHNGCSLAATLVLITLIVITILFQIRSYLVGVALSLRGFYSVVQKEKVANSAIRILMLPLVISVGLQNAVSYMIVGLLATVLSVNLYLYRAACGIVKSGSSPDVSASISFRKHMLVGLPACLTYMFEAQISSLLLALFGNVAKVADLGVIARFGLIFVVPLTMLRDFLIPRMATQENLGELKKTWISSCLVAATASILLLVVSAIFCKPLLSLLGREYSHLHNEMLLFLSFYSCAFFFGVVASPVNARGWVKHSWIRPIVVLGAQAATLPNLDLSTVRGAILLGWAASVGNIVLDMFLLFRGWQGRGNLSLK